MAQSKRERLQLSLISARDSYQALKRTLEVAETTAQGTRGRINVASRALPPDEPMAARTGINVALAVGLVLVLALGAELALGWWRETQQLEEAARRQWGGADPVESITTQSRLENTGDASGAGATQQDAMRL